MKNRGIIRVSGTDVTGLPASINFTSDAISMASFKGLTLTFWIDSLSVSGISPTLTVEISGSTDVDSFVKVVTELDITTIEPSVVLEDFSIEVEYVRFIFTSNGASSGNIAYELRKL